MAVFYQSFHEFRSGLEELTATLKIDQLSKDNFQYDYRLGHECKPLKIFNTWTLQNHFVGFSNKLINQNSLTDTRAEQQSVLLKYDLVHLAPEISYWEISGHFMVPYSSFESQPLTKFGLCGLPSVEIVQFQFDIF